jgi:hypothetical protein
MDTWLNKALDPKTSVYYTVTNCFGLQVVGGLGFWGWDFGGALVGFQSTPQ